MTNLSKIGAALALVLTSGVAQAGSPLPKRTVDYARRVVRAYVAGQKGLLDAPVRIGINLVAASYKTADQLLYFEAGKGPSACWARFASTEVRTTRSS